jgi:hypothetical protein
MKSILHVITMMSLLLFAACTEVEQVVPENYDTPDIVFQGEAVGNLIDPPFSYCGPVIQLDNKEMLEVNEAVDGFWMCRPGDRIVFSYQERTDVMSVCMLGKVVDITYARKLGRVIDYGDKPKDIVGNPN